MPLRFCRNQPEGGIHVIDLLTGDQSCQEQFSGLRRQVRWRRCFQRVCIARPACSIGVGPRAVRCRDRGLRDNASPGACGYGSRPRRTRDSSNLFEAFCEAPEEQLRGCGSHCRPVGGSVRSSARHPRVQAKKLLPSRDFRCETAIFGLQTQKALALQGGLVKR